MSDNNEGYEPVNDSFEKVESEKEVSGTSAAEDAMRSILANVGGAKEEAFDAVNNGNVENANDEDAGDDEGEGSDDLYREKSESEEEKKEEGSASEGHDSEEGSNKDVNGKEELEDESSSEDSRESSKEEGSFKEDDEAEKAEEQEQGDEKSSDEGSDESNREQVEKQEGEEESPVGHGSQEDPKPVSVQDSVKDLMLNNEMLQKQANYIMDSDMLSLSEFQELSSRDKVTAIVNMLNSNPETSLPAWSSSSSGSGSGSGTSNSDNGRVVEQRSRPGQIVDEKQRTDLNRPMTAAERDRYNKYLRGENKITEMQDIPPRSRLFIGNLPLKNVSKEELFRIFSPYGHILQINIKNAFGFIQYDNPQSVRTAIAAESQEMNFGKKLILEISSSNARPQYDHGDHGTNSSSTFISSSKRPFQHEDSDAADMYNDTQSYKKSKRRVPAGVIYVKRTADRNYANEVFNQFRRGTGLETDMIFLKPRMELRRMINDVAYDGVWGVILVNKTRNVDIQIFYKGPQGETKFDEYISISSDDAIAIFNKLKTSRGSGGMPASAAPPPATLVGAPNPYAAAPPPPPQQSYYSGYGLTPPMPQQPPMAPQQPPYVQAATSAYAPYGAPAPAPAPATATPYGRYQPQLAQSMAAPPAAVPPPPAADPGQQQLLAAIQNLPPNVVSNLLAAAQQQQQQQQQPQSNQQLLGLLQSMQPQQHQQQFAAQPPPPQPQPQFQQPHHQPPPTTLTSPPQQNQQPQPSAGNNVQSLLDSLAKLQK